jgi:hypothetical protein
VPIPSLSLSQGQLLWAVSLGQEPSPEVRDRARYLALQGIPRPVTVPGPGRGRRIVYDFDDLILVGLALLALAEGYKPRVMKDYLVRQRERFLVDAHAVWGSLPEGILDHPDSLKRNSVVVYEDDYYVRLSGRGRGERAELEFILPDAGPPYVAEVIPGEAPAKVFPLKFWMPKWVAWAMRAPTRTPGPKTGLANRM